MKRSNVFFGVLVFALIVAGTAFAADHGGGHGELFTSEKIWNYVFRVVNFILFIGVIVYFAGSKIKTAFVGRRVQIQQDLDDLQARQAEAEKKLKDVEKGIANMAAEKEAILAEAKQQGEAQKDAIIAKAVKDAEALKEQAKRTAENEAKAAIDTIRAEMADLVVAAAERIVQERLSEKDHDKLVDDYLTKVVLN